MENILTYVSVLCLFSISMILLFLYLNTRKKLRLSDEKLKSSQEELDKTLRLSDEKLKSSQDELDKTLKLYNEKLNDLKKIFHRDLISNNGYYVDYVRFSDAIDKPVQETYTCNVFVREVDRYTNGMSKIVLVSIEVIQGFTPAKYEGVKRVLESRFSSVKNTKEITWLESEDAIKKLRKEKLERLMNQ